MIDKVESRETYVLENEDPPLATSPEDQGVHCSLNSTKWLLWVTGILVSQVG